MTDSLTDGLAAFAVLAYLAYLASRVLARQNLPELLGFLLAGVLLGPSALGLVSEEDLSRFQPLTEIALAILMFVIGERVSRRALGAARWAVTAGVTQFVLAAGATYVAIQWAGGSQSVALLLAVLAGAGAPMTVAHVVTSTRASGPYPAGLVGTHAVCDSLAVVAFAAVLPAATLLVSDDADIAEAVVDFIRLGVGGFALGLAGGLIISRLGRQIETSGELLLFVLIHLLLGWAIADVLDVSLPLAAVVAGATASTTSPTNFSQRLFRTVRSIEQPVYLMFFALAGAGIHLEDVPQVGLLGITYIAVRTVTKIVGGTAGGLLGGLGWRQARRLGIDLIPQAGVAVGLAALAAEQLPEQGSEVATVVLGSVVLFELVGPVLVARGLRRSDNGDPDGPFRPPPSIDLQAIPEKVLVAGQEPVALPAWLLDCCHRWHAQMIVLTPAGDGDPDMEKLRARAAAAMVDLHVELVDEIRQESFTGLVVRAAEEAAADLVVLFTPKRTEPHASSRLVLWPNERIARELTVPVVSYPVPDPGHSVLPWRRPR